MVRYDGSDFKTFNTTDGLTDNTVFRIKEDDLGRIWFMTYNREICFYQEDQFYPFEYNNILDSTLTFWDVKINDVITDFRIDSLGNYHFCFMNFTTTKITKKGEVEVRIFELKESNFEYSFPQTGIKNFHQELKKHLKNNDRFNKFIVVTEEWSKVHLINKKEDLFISTPNGLYVISKSTQKIPERLFKDYYITGLDIDFEGGMWLSTLNNGVLYVPNPQLTHYTLRKGEAIRNMLIQKDLAVFPLAKNGLHNLYLDTQNYSLKTYPHLLQGELIPEQVLEKGLRLEKQVGFKNIVNTTLGVVKFENGRIMYFSNHKFNFNGKLSPEELSKVNLKGYHINVSVQDENWYGKKGEIFDYKKSDLSIINGSFEYPFHFKVLKPVKLHNGNILLATTKGLFEMNPPDYKVIKAPNFHPIIGKRIEDIIQLNDQSLVFATKAEGIFMWKDSVMTNISKANGLLSNQVHQLNYDSNTNTIWVATNNGLSKLTQLENQKWNSESMITSYDGLESQDIRSFMFYRNLLAFSNSKGLNLIAKNDLKIFSTPPKLWVNKTMVNNQNVQALNHISLPYDSNNISISFHAISYKSKQNIDLAYQLLPNDSIWISTSGNEINLTSLAPGEYALNVKSLNYSGAESPITTIHFSIVPAFWMTWWFYLLIILIGLAGVYYISSKSIQIYKNQAKFQRSLKEMHVVSLQSKMNPHFIFNSLNSIQNYILKNERLKANEYLLEFSSLIRAILQNSEHTSISLLKELETLRMYVALEKKRIRKEFEYTEKIDPEIDLNQCTIPTLLIQPYIENSIWHGKVYTNPNGKIEVSISKQADSLAFEISDNGIGIENAERSKVRVKGYKSIGSEATKKRIQLLSELNNDITEVKISKKNSESEEFPGTKITFSVPYKIHANLE